MHARIALLLSVAAVFAVVLAACGEEDVEDAVDDVTTAVEGGTTDADVDTEALERELSEAERIVREQLPELAQAESLEDVSAAAESIREDVEESAENLAEVDLEADPDLDQARDQLEEALRDLRSQLEEVETAVENEDLGGAVTESTEAMETGRRRVEDAIAEVRALLER